MNRNVIFKFRRLYASSNQKWWTRRALSKRESFIRHNSKLTNRSVRLNALSGERKKNELSCFYTASRGGTPCIMCTRGTNCRGVTQRREHLSRRYKTRFLGQRALYAVMHARARAAFLDTTRAKVRRRSTDRDIDTPPPPERNWYTGACQMIRERSEALRRWKIDGSRPSCSQFSRVSYCSFLKLKYAYCKKRENK